MCLCQNYLTCYHSIYNKLNLRKSSICEIRALSPCIINNGKHICTVYVEQTAIYICRIPDSSYRSTHKVVQNNNYYRVEWQWICGVGLYVVVNCCAILLVRLSGGTARGFNYLTVRHLISVQTLVMICDRSEIAGLSLFMGPPIAESC